MLSQLLRHDPSPAQPPISTNLHLIAVLPNSQSPASQFIIESLPDVNIECSLFRTDRQEAASSYIIQSQANRSRTIVSINELQEMQVSEFCQKVLQVAPTDGEHGQKRTWFHFEGRIPDVTYSCAEFLRKHFPHARVSVECEKPERTGMADVAKLADVVFYSKIWAEKNGFTNARSFLEAQCVDRREGAILCCTWGSGGAMAVKKGVEDSWADVKAWKGETTNVVDTIGAGDTFVAGMLFSLNNHEDWPLQRKLEFANELAGRKVLQEGFGNLGASMW